MPRSEESERAILGAVLLDTSLFSRLSGRLKPDDFYCERNRVVYSAMLGLRSAGHEIDLRTVQAALEQQSRLDVVGGVAYLASLDLELPDRGLGRIDNYVEIIKERSVRRRLIEACGYIARNCRDGGLVARDAVQRGEKLLAELRDDLCDPSVAKVAYVAPWPTMAATALRGLAGDFVRLVEPHSEADPAALLVQFLVAIGNLIGRSPYFSVEADQHHLNNFTVVVGETAKARKGTSWGYVNRVLGLVDPEWLGRVRSGISSGEGIVFEVRDSSYRENDDGDRELISEGVDDKRLLLLEPEFASVLKHATRQGNTASTTLRDAWDQDKLSPITKTSRVCASDPHVSMVGHVTRQELVRHLTETDAASGFGNRILWVCARRSKILPRGGRFLREDLRPLVRRIRSAVEFAQAVGEIDRDKKAWADWDLLYGPLSEGKPGLLGALLGRAEAHVTRLSSLYALLDRSAVIKPEHQAAAVAVWDYCEASARYVFGDALGNPVADEVLRALRAAPEGLTRTEIRDLFKRHKGKAEIGRAMEVLVRQNFVRRTSEQTGGRPVERWIAKRDISDKSDERKTS